MATVDTAVTARYSSKGKHFEILVDCEKAIAYKQGTVKLSDAIVGKDIFTTVRSAEHANEKDLLDVFGTIAHEKVMEKILKEGEIQLTTEFRNKLREEKKKQLIALIHRNAINPQNNLPHPPARIEAAFEQARVKIDEHKKAEDQVQDIAKQLTKILPIKFETRKLRITIPAAYAAKTFQSLKTHGTLLNEQWNNDGSLQATLELPAGLQEDLENQLNKLTKGEAQIEITQRR